jgi:hypothetical protein
VAGMAAGANSIDDMGLLRHGAMDVLFGGVRAPSTLGSHPRCSPGSRARRRCFPSPMFWASSTSTRPKAVYGHQKQSVRFGHTKIQAAPRGALSYPRCSREKFGERFLGLMAYLDPKGEGKRRGNPWGMAETSGWTGSPSWTSRSPVIDRKIPDDAEYLYWVGCAGALEDRAKKATKAIAELLDAAGVKFAVLGPMEACTSTRPAAWARSACSRCWRSRTWRPSTRPA